MASSYVLMTFIAMATIVVHSASAKEFMVGGDKGWTTNVNYEAWAAGKDFRVGDQLVFKYEQRAHNVFKVDASTFQQCVPPPTNEALTSGNDIITLETPGRKWYICSIRNHCEDGKQKLEITVFPQSLSPAPTQQPPQSGGPASTAHPKTGIMFHVSALLLVITTVLMIPV